MIAHSWIKKILLLIVPLPVFSVFAGSVQAFTVTSEPFTDLVEGVTPCYVDQAQQLLNKLAVEAQGSTPQTIKSQLNPQDLQALSVAMTCAYQAALLGVQKIPAVVDQQYVVYGNPDMTGSLAEIQDAKSNS